MDMWTRELNKAWPWSAQTGTVRIEQRGRKMVLLDWLGNVLVTCGEYACIEDFVSKYAKKIGNK